MAKVSFNKLSLVSTEKEDVITVNGEEIRVKLYVPIETKLKSIANVINLSNTGQRFINKPVLFMYTVLETFYLFTNINFTDKQKENPYKLFDLLYGSGLYNRIYELSIEVKKFYEDVFETAEAIYGQINSVYGILDSISQDYSNLNFDAEKLQEKLSDKENLRFLRDVMNKLG